MLSFHKPFRFSMQDPFFSRWPPALPSPPSHTFAFPTWAFRTSTFFPHAWSIWTLPKPCGNPSQIFSQKISHSYRSVLRTFVFVRLSGPYPEVFVIPIPYPKPDILLPPGGVRVLGHSSGLPEGFAKIFSSRSLWIFQCPFFTPPKEHVPASNLPHPSFGSQHLTYLHFLLGLTSSRTPAPPPLLDRFRLLT